jgi:hypothetical protein
LDFPDLPQLQLIASLIDCVRNLRRQHAPAEPLHNDEKQDARLLDYIVTPLPLASPLD